MTNVPARIGLVLGAGGSVGHAFHLGVLDALSREFGWDARTAAVIVGTSAGSVVGAGLRSGLGADDMRRRALGQPLSPQGAAIARRVEAAVDAARRRQRPRPAQARMLGSPARLRRALREPWNVKAGSLFSAMMPPGVVPGDHLGAPYDALWGISWPDRPLWIVAVDLDVGTRVVFGRAGCAARPPRPGGAGVVCDPGLLRAGGDRNRSLRRRWRAFHHQRRPARRRWPRPRSDQRTDVDGEWHARAVPRYAMRQIARRWVAGEVAALRARGIEVATMQPTSPDIDVMSGNAMDASKAPAVIEQVSASTLAHIRDRRVAERLAALRRAGP